MTAKHLLGNNLSTRLVILTQMTILGVLLFEKLLLSTIVIDDIPNHGLTLLLRKNELEVDLMHDEFDIITD